MNPRDNASRNGFGFQIPRGDGCFCITGIYMVSKSSMIGFEYPKKNIDSSNSLGCEEKSVFISIEAARVINIDPIRRGERKKHCSQ